MAIRIGNDLSTRSLRQTQESLQKTFAQLSSAKRITKAGDDAAGLAISEKLRAAERSFQQAERNLSDGISFTRTAEGAIQEQTDIAIRLRELAVQSQNGVVDEAGQKAIQNEFDQLTSELTRIAETTRFNNQKLLNGETSGAGAVTVNDGNGSGSVVQISISDLRAGALGLEGQSARDGAVLDKIDRAITKLNSTRGDLGAAESRLSSGIANIRQIRENTLAAGSRIADADFAEVTANKTKNQIQLRIQTAVQGQANISSALALSLLRPGR
jgi:flagellin